MNQIDEILSRKIHNRISRQKIEPITTIHQIIKECSSDLGIEEPKLIFCDTLRRSFNAFKLKSEHYLLYDNNLIESLYIFNHIAMDTSNTDNMDKFFYKLFAEELICGGDLIHSLYFSGKYRLYDYTFVTDKTPNILEQSTRQIYFLMGHELMHISLSHNEGNSNNKISDEFIKVIKVATRILMEKFVKDDSSELEVLSKVSGYFLKEIVDNFNDYMNKIEKSERFLHFVEECYCDYTGLKLLLEHYSGAEKSIAAITNTLNFLIIFESIRSDLFFGIKELNSITKEAHDTLYYSVLRVQVLLIILQMNSSELIKLSYNEVKDCSPITERLEHFIKSLPSDKSMSVIDDSILPNLDKETLISYILKSLSLGIKLV